jgi:Protein of unknown function (DUF2752)
MIHSTRSRVANALRTAVPPAVVALAVMLLLRFSPESCRFYPQCPFHQLLGLQCPGCGATRALADLLHGHLAAAIHFNALATLLFPVVAVYGIFVYAQFLRRKPICRPNLPPATIYTALAVTALFGVARNLPSF